MNDASEWWSLPWHALQRRLALSECDLLTAEATFRTGLSERLRKLADTEARLIP